MANKRWQDTNPCHKEEDTHKNVTQPKGKTPGVPDSPNFVQHPKHTGPKP